VDLHYGSVRVGVWLAVFMTLKRVRGVDGYRREFESAGSLSPTGALRECVPARFPHGGGTSRSNPIRAFSLKQRSGQPKIVGVSQSRFAGTFRTKNAYMASIAIASGTPRFAAAYRGINSAVNVSPHKAVTHIPTFRCYIVAAYIALKCKRCGSAPGVCGTWPHGS
jgi:hypothetical protein